VKDSDTAREHVYVVDDDAAVRDALSVMLTLEGFQVFGFADGESFLAAVRCDRPDCIILDVHMPGRSGLDVLKELQQQRTCAVPLFIISGHGDIPMAVDAIKNGALDFIEKPFHAETLVTRIREAITAARRKSLTGAGSRPLPDFPGRDQLTPRECQVLELIANGASSKDAGRRLGISPRTIEVHRARVMEKLGAKNTIDLVHIVLSERG
jgi:two-component system, LuxR family, response regulator FixJ